MRITMHISCEFALTINFVVVDYTNTSVYDPNDNEWTRRDGIFLKHLESHRVSRS